MADLLRVSFPALTFTEEFVDSESGYSIDILVQRRDNSGPYTLNPEPYTRHPKPYTLHPTP